MKWFLIHGATRDLAVYPVRYGLDIVNERFNGKAYSLVRKDNSISQRLVESNGFVVVGEDGIRLTYLYGGSGK